MAIRILSIDDNPDDRLLAIRELNRVFADLVVEQIGDAQAFEQVLLQGNFDLVVTDYRLGWSDGIAVVRAIKDRYPDIPIVMFTDSGNEEIAVEAMKAGIDDYVLKSPKHYFRLSVAVRASLEQSRQRQALQEAEIRYSNLFNRVPVGLYRMTPNWQILVANPALVQLLGYQDQAALLAINAIDIHLDREVRQQWQERLERDGLLQGFETPLRTLNGKIIWVRHDATAVKDSQSQIVYYEGAIKDITERKQAEEARQALLLREQAARAEAEAASRMKDEFLTTLSHELRTPLNAILGWASLLRQRKLDIDTVNRALETIERNAKAQTQLIEDLLDVSRIIRGQLRLTISPVNLVLVIEEALDAVRPAAVAKAIQLATVYPAVDLEAQSSKVRVMGDANRLQQVMWNLLSNAIKFTSSGGLVEVRLSLSQNQDNLTQSLVVIQVKDTGQGISADFLPHIFDYFRQADSTMTRSHSGLGLGLAIVRQLVELHGGTVDAASPGIGQGSTFTIKLPLLATNEQSETNAAPVQTPYILSEHSTDFFLTDVQVLLVEDEADTREMLKLALQQSGAKVTAVASATEAKRAITQFQPNVIISDIAMPGEDGYELMRQWREQGQKAPAIALTAYARDLDRAAAIAAGFQQHMSKPVEPDELIVAVAQMVARK